MIPIIETVAEMQAQAQAWRQQGLSIGLVPTMGYLHQGHLSLIEHCSSQHDITAISIFVNPLQFGPNEDYAKYLRNLPRDHELAAQAGADCIFYPSVEAMYPPGFDTTVQVSKLSKNLCGKSRPTHFAGVTTVVAKLFNIILPHVAYFGQKDAQQVRIIEQMVADLNLPLTIHRLPIVRESDGLAMSSRNEYLSPDERSQAVVLNQALKLAADLYWAGETNVDKLKAAMLAHIATAPLGQVDYIEIVAADSLEPVAEIITGPVLVALAVKFGGTRLIDNMMF